MSAWIVSREHIDALVQGLVESELVVGVDPTEMGRELWLENVKSIHARYPDTAENDADYPGPIDFTKAHADEYTYTRPAKRLALDSLLKQAECYDYQTCEHPEYEHSTAKEWIDTLTDSLTNAGINSHGDGLPWGL